MRLEGGEMDYPKPLQVGPARSSLKPSFNTFANPHFLIQWRAPDVLKAVSGGPGLWEELEEYFEPFRRKHPYVGGASRMSLATSSNAL